MSDTPPPTTIEELFFRLDKRLALIEAEQLAHCKDHTKIGRILDDHEAGLRAGMTVTGVMTSSGVLLALIALIKSFFST
jgi:tRNA A37 threonylcarbamoyladenosine synthetase subunit TsaC/SUA5/YrdC